MKKCQMEEINESEIVCTKETKQVTCTVQLTCNVYK